MPLTEKQQRVYELALKYFEATGEPCSVSWLARQLHRDRHTVRHHATAIVKKGWANSETPAFRRLHQQSA